MIIDEWLMPNIFFSSIRRGKLQHVKELLEYNSAFVGTLDSEDQNVFHVMTCCNLYTEDILCQIILAFESRNDIQDIINKEDIYGRTPINLAIRLRKRR